MNKRSWSILIVVLALIGGTAGLLAYWRTNQRLGQPGVKVVPQPVRDPDGNIVGTNSVYLPEQVLSFSSKPVPVTPLELGWLPKDTTYGRRMYKAPDGFEMVVSVVLMGTDRTSIHKPQYCLTGQGWRIDHSETTAIPVKGPPSYNLPVMKLTATGVRETSGGGKIVARGIYVYWFVADKELTADHLQRMWWMARDLIRTGTLQRWAYVSCFAVCTPGEEEATYQRMKEFVGAAVPEFQLTNGRSESFAVALP
ncbi:MAG TPA: exosortase-associated EpsI family protein [Candidatus Angelobacter sp.]|nr:exosortase-associated EpsI family protein [Candidatus Angelobacter sp.]